MKAPTTVSLTTHQTSSSASSFPGGMPRRSAVGTADTTNDSLNKENTRASAACVIKSGSYAVCRRLQTSSLAHQSTRETGCPNHCKPYAIPPARPSIVTSENSGALGTTTAFAKTNSEMTSPAAVPGLGAKIPCHQNIAGKKAHPRTWDGRAQANAASSQHKKLPKSTPDPHSVLSRTVGSTFVSREDPDLLHNDGVSSTLVPSSRAAQSAADFAPSSLSWTAITNAIVDAKRSDSASYHLEESEYLMIYYNDTSRMSIVPVLQICCQIDRLQQNTIRLSFLPASSSIATAATVALLDQEEGLNCATKEEQTRRIFDGEYPRSQRRSDQLCKVEALAALNEMVNWVTCPSMSACTSSLESFPGVLDFADHTVAATLHQLVWHGVMDKTLAFLHVHSQRCFSLLKDTSKKARKKTPCSLQLGYHDHVECVVTAANAIVSFTDFPRQTPVRFSAAQSLADAAVTTVITQESTATKRATRPQTTKTGVQILMNAITVHSAIHNQGVVAGKPAVVVDAATATNGNGSGTFIQSTSIQKESAMSRLVEPAYALWHALSNITFFASARALMVVTDQVKLLQLSVNSLKSLPEANQAAAVCIIMVLRNLLSSVPTSNNERTLQLPPFAKEASKSIHVAFVDNYFLTKCIQAVCHRRHASWRDSKNLMHRLLELIEYGIHLGSKLSNSGDGYDYGASLVSVSQTEWQASIIPFCVSCMGRHPHTFRIHQRACRIFTVGMQHVNKSYLIASGVPSALILTIESPFIQDFDTKHLASSLLMWINQP